MKAKLAQLLVKKGYKQIINLKKLFTWYYTKKGVINIMSYKKMEYIKSVQKMQYEFISMSASIKI